MLDLTIRIEGLDDLEEEWKRSLIDLARGCREGVRDGVTDGAAEAKANRGYTDKTGRLTDSINGRETGGSLGDYAGAVGELVADAPYAGFVNDGTKAHWIRPKMGTRVSGPLRVSQSRRARGTGPQRRYLAWQEPTGKWHFAREVYHPGTRAYGFMDRGAEKCEAVMLAAILAAIERVKKNLER